MRNLSLVALLIFGLSATVFAQTTRRFDGDKAIQFELSGEHSFQYRFENSYGIHFGFAYLNRIGETNLRFTPSVNIGVGVSLPGNYSMNGASTGIAYQGSFNADFYYDLNLGGGVYWYIGGGLGLHNYFGVSESPDLEWNDSPLFGHSFFVGNIGSGLRLFTGQRRVSWALEFFKYSHSLDQREYYRWATPRLQLILNLD